MNMGDPGKSWGSFSEDSCPLIAGWMGAEKSHKSILLIKYTFPLVLFLNNFSVAFTLLTAQIDGCMEIGMMDMNQ